MKSTRRDSQIADANNTFSYMDLPDDMIDLVGGFFAVKDQAAYAQTCRRLNSLFQPNIDKIVEPVLKQLLQHAVDGNKDEIIKTLDKNPGLIIKFGEVLDKVGQLRWGSVFTILLGGGDPLSLVVESYFDKIQNGEQEKYRQVLSLFPSADELGRHGKYNFRKLIDIIAADPIINNNNNEMSEETSIALQEFKTSIGLNSKQAITSGLHFDVFTYVDMLQAYADKIYDFQNWSQRSFYCCKVEGFLQSRFPCYLAKITCRGANGYSAYFDMRTYDFLNTRLGDMTDFYSKNLGDSHFIYFPIYVALAFTRASSMGKPLSRLDGFKQYAEKMFDMRRHLYEDALQYFQGQKMARK
jgi:hypothetical protein